jgi:hypothetical protein
MEITIIEAKNCFILDSDPGTNSLRLAVRCWTEEVLVDPNPKN